MTLREFLEQNSDAIQEAANCKSAKEFEKLANAIGITFDNNEQLEEAFDIVKKQNSGQLTTEDLDAVSGGKSLFSRIKLKPVRTSPFTDLSSICSAGSSKKRSK